MTITKKEIDILERDMLWLIQVTFDKRRRSSLDYYEYEAEQKLMKSYFQKLRELSK